MRRFVPGIIALLVGCCAAWPEDLNLSASELRIPRGESRRLEFGTVPQKDTTVLLDLVARLDSDGLGGSMLFMKIVLNGHVVRLAKSRTAVRLVNRKPQSPVAPNLPATWSDNTAWRVLYAPDFEGALKLGFYEGNPYQTVLDITDLTNPAAENRLEITNTCQYAPPPGAKGNHDLVIRTAAVHTRPGASPLMSTGDLDQDAVNTGTPWAGPAAYRGALLPGGGFRLSSGACSFSFGAAISYPGAGFSKLQAGEPATGGQPGFTVATRATPTGGEVLAAGPDYRLRRQVRFTPRRVEVSDEFTNLHAEAPLGLQVENSVDLKATPARVRLAGNPDPALSEYYSPGNPSVYAALSGRRLGLGLICEDDVYRNQATLFFDAERMAAGLRTPYLCLPAGGSYTLRWSVYPVASEDYYDFINLVRADWGANYTVEGAWTFFDPDTILATDVEKLREQFTSQGVTRACYCGGWVDRKHDKHRIGFGTGVLDDYWTDFRSRLRQAAERIHAAVPGCKVYVYYDTQRDTSEGGHERFRDSWLTDPKGNQFSTEWNGLYSLTYSVVATLENSYGRAMLAAVDRYLDEMGIDGLYWDEMEGVGYGAPLITYNVPDGHSCLLNPKTYTIDRQTGINTIMGEGHRLAVIRRVRERGGDLMGNGPTATRDLLALHPQRMIEIQHNEYWNYEGNLQSPLGYAGGRPDFGNWLRGLQLGCLLVGTRYNYSYEIQRYTFPFTPLELHAGYLLGQERIIATHSGNYGWPADRSLVQARYFDTEGKLTPREAATIIAREARTAVTLATGEAVVLVRLPAWVQPLKGEASATALDYTGEHLRLVLRSPGGCRLHLRGGLLPVRAGQRLSVRVGGTARTAVAGRDGVLTVEVPAAAAPVAVVVSAGAQ